MCKDEIQKHLPTSVHSRYEFTSLCTRVCLRGVGTDGGATDTESLTWDLFDDSFRKQLDANKYVSLFRERKTTEMNESWSKESGDNNHENNPAAVQAAETEAVQSSTKPNLDELPEGRADSDSDSDCEGPECSLFDLKMPGIMTTEELDREVDLDHWLLYDRDMFVEMEVCSFLFG